jgi:hypothetical protein
MSKLIFSFLVFHVLICRSYSSVYPKEEDNAKINVIDTSGDGRHESVTSLFHDPQLVSNSLKQSFSEYQVLKVKHDLEKRNQLYQDLDGSKFQMFVFLGNLCFRNDGSKYFIFSLPDDANNKGKLKQFFGSFGHAKILKNSTA